MLHFSRRTKIFFSFFIFIVLGYALVSFWKGTKVPQGFSDARLQGAAIAANIVTLSTQSTNDLLKVNQYDKEADYTNALTLTTDLVVRSQEIRNQALALSVEVEKMTRALPSINPQDAKQAALEAVSSRLALVNQLINYSNDLGVLLNTLRDRFTGTPTPVGRVQAIVDQINTDVAAVNNFNMQATQAMVRFDAIMAKQ